MANKEKRIREDERANVGREKAKDQESIEAEIDKRGHHMSGEQLGNLGPDGIAPLTEQEKRNRGISHAPSGGEAAWRGDGVETRPRESKPERLREDIGIEDRPSGRASVPSESRPSHP
jgi:hypothetical protein